MQRLLPADLKIGSKSHITHSRNYLYIIYGYIYILDVKWTFAVLKSGFRNYLIGNSCIFSFMILFYNLLTCL